MEIKTVCVCDKCKQVILCNGDGFIVHGNIYVADPNNIGGLVGDNFPKGENGIMEQFTIEEVKKSCFCKRCFCEALYMDRTGEVG